MGGRFALEVEVYVGVDVGEKGEVGETDELGLVAGG